MILEYQTFTVPMVMKMKSDNQNILATVDLEDTSSRSPDKSRMEAVLIVYKTKSTKRTSYGSSVSYKYRRSQHRIRKSFGPFVTFVEALEKALIYWYGA